MASSPQKCGGWVKCHRSDRRSPAGRLRIRKKILGKNREFQTDGRTWVSDRCWQPPIPFGRPRAATGEETGKATAGSLDDNLAGLLPTTTPITPKFAAPGCAGVVAAGASGRDARGAVPGRRSWARCLVGPLHRRSLGAQQVLPISIRIGAGGRLE